MLLFNFKIDKDNYKTTNLTSEIFAACAIYTIH